MPPVDMGVLKDDFEKFQSFIKLFAPLAPGADKAEKTKNLDAMIDPAVDKWLADKGVPDEFVLIVNTGIDWAIATELTALGVV